MKLFKQPFVFLGLLIGLLFSCNVPEKADTEQDQNQVQMTAKDILGNPDYQAISYGGYREISRDAQPSIAELKADMQILSAMGIRIFRTYNTELAQASNVLAAISELKKEDPSFEMYVMLGAWIACKDAGSENPDHDSENEEANAAEIERAIALAKQYPDIVKIIAVGNEAMVKWAASYYVQPGIILKWVEHLQDLKQKGELSSDLWITSSDNFASWGGGGAEYHVEDLEKLIKAVDYISLHTYPMHDTHYNADFWGVAASEADLSKEEQIEAAMDRSLQHAITQYQNTATYVKSLGIDKDIHIGETGWASFSNGHFSPEGSKACDEYKEALYYHKIRDWTTKNNIACFYFEAFNEIWKDANNQGGSENHFGLFTLDGQAKYAIWDLVDQGIFEGLSRGTGSITKTYDGDKAALMEEVMVPPMKDFVSQEN